MTELTITRPGQYTNGDDCYVTENAQYPGILGYGKTPEESRGSFEAARQAYDELVHPARETVAEVTLTFFKSVTASRGMPPRKLAAV